MARVTVSPSDGVRRPGVHPQTHFGSGLKMPSRAAKELLVPSAARLSQTRSGLALSSSNGRSAALRPRLTACLPFREVSRPAVRQCLPPLFVGGRPPLALAPSAVSRAHSLRVTGLKGWAQSPNTNAFSGHIQRRRWWCSAAPRISYGLPGQDSYRAPLRFYIYLSRRVPDGSSQVKAITGGGHPNVRISVPPASWTR